MNHKFPQHFNYLREGRFWPLYSKMNNCLRTKCLKTNNYFFIHFLIIFSTFFDKECILTNNYCRSQKLIFILSRKVTEWKNARNFKLIKTVMKITHYS